MRKLAVLVPVLLLAAPLSAFASHSGNNLDLYYISTDLEFVIPGEGSASGEGDGFGIKGQFSFAPDMYLTGEYQSVEPDDGDGSFDQMRFGVGGRAQIGQQLWGRLQVEYFDMELDGEDLDDGVGMHAGILVDADVFSIYADAGYLKLGDSSGPEFLVGAAAEVAPQFGVFADYRRAMIDVDDSDLEFNIDDFRVGLRLSF